jgi:hypothetical protein
MKTTKLISYINLLGCIYWSVFGLVTIEKVLKHRLHFKGSALVFPFLLALFATTISGMISFAAGRGKQPENIKTTNAISIIRTFHFFICICWLIIGLALLIAGPPRERPIILVFVNFSALFATTISGIILYYEDSRQVLVRLWKVKRLTILWIGIVIIAAMCLFPPFVTIAGTVGYNHLFSNEVYLWDGSHPAHIDFVRLLIQCAIVSLITAILFCTIKDKKTETGVK